MSTSIEAALTITKARLAGHSDIPAREAEWLIEHLTGLDRTHQLLLNNQQLTTRQTTSLERLTERRLQGEPLAYVLGEQHFWTLRLAVDPSVLIPRPETELVVERALLLLPLDSQAAVLDLGTGSGAIALALASERPNTRVLATDCSPAALDLARRNATSHRITNVRFELANWLEDMGSQRFELILSNPPYIAESDPDVATDVRTHEPHLALYAGNDGLDALRTIVRDAPRHLALGGWLILEHGWQQAAAVSALLESAGFSGVASHADLAGHVRVTEAQWTGD